MTIFKVNCAPPLTCGFLKKCRSDHALVFYMSAGTGRRKRHPDRLAPALATVLESVTTESKGKGYGHESLMRAAKCAVNDNTMPPSATTRVGLVAKPVATNSVLKATRKGKHIKNGIPQYDGARCTVTR